MKNTSLYAASALALTCAQGASAQGQADAEGAAVDVLDTIIVIGSRIARVIALPSYRILESVYDKLFVIDYARGGRLAPARAIDRRLIVDTLWHGRIAVPPGF